MFETEVVHAFDESILKDIISVNRASFPSGWVYSDAVQYYRDMLHKTDSIHILLKHEGKSVGYLLAIPHNDAVLELKNDDPEMKDDPMKYYIETTSILPDYRGKKGFSKILERLIEECRKRKITKISLHARVATGLSEIIQRKFKVTEVRRIERWPYYNFEEPTDYIEALIAPAT
jgi:hypothetical protein